MSHESPHLRGSQFPCVSSVLCNCVKPRFSWHGPDHSGMCGLTYVPLLRRYAWVRFEDLILFCRASHLWRICHSICKYNRTPSREYSLFALGDSCGCGVSLLFWIKVLCCNYKPGWITSCHSSSVFICGSSLSHTALISTHCTAVLCFILLSCCFTYSPRPSLRRVEPAMLTVLIHIFLVSHGEFQL